MMTVPILSRGLAVDTTDAYNYRTSGTRQRRHTNGCLPLCTGNGRKELGGIRNGAALLSPTNLNGLGSSRQCVVHSCSGRRCLYRDRVTVGWFRLIPTASAQQPHFLK